VDFLQFPFAQTLRFAFLVEQVFSITARASRIIQMLAYKASLGAVLV